MSGCARTSTAFQERQRAGAGVGAGVGVDAADEADLLKKTVAAAAALFASLVKISSEPTGAVALADGRLLCQSTPCSKMLSAGAHEITFQEDGYDNEAQRVQAKKGLVVTGRPTRIAATLSIDTEPSGLPVSIDGERVGQSPVSRRELQPGAHEVVIDDPCWLRSGERVALKKGEDRSLHIAGKQRMAGLKLKAEDEKGNAVEATAKLDGRSLGAVPGSFAVPACGKALVVEGEGIGVEQAVALQEGKVLALTLKLAATGPVAGRASREPKTGYELVALPGGTLSGGNFSGERVAPFSLGRTAVTVAAYKRCVDAGACSAPSAGGDCNWGTDWMDHPVNCVDWNQAKAHCGWIGGRLPTAQEREWAASGGEGREYPWGDQEPSRRACWDGRGNDLGEGNRHRTCRVGSHSAGASKHGLLDLAGNVWEWMANDYNFGKEVRGGSWSSASPANLRASSRLGHAPANWVDFLGFRCGL